MHIYSPKIDKKRVKKQNFKQKNRAVRNTLPDCIILKKRLTNYFAER